MNPQQFEEPDPTYRQRDRQANTQTDKRKHKCNLPGGGNDLLKLLCVYTNCK